MTALLPINLASVLGPATSRTDFLSSLSSGQLLCMAYNTCVRKSKKPWGYVSKDSIHDIIALEKAQAEVEGEGAGKKGWTFRRTDNLRLWAGYVFHVKSVSASALTLISQCTKAAVHASDPDAQSTAQPNVSHRTHAICFQSRLNQSHARIRDIATEGATGVYNGASYRV